MIKVNFRVIKKPWTIQVVPKKDYRKKYGKDSCAVTIMHKRKIVLNQSLGADLETIIHELVHAYKSELCVYSSNLDEAAKEEFYCELISKRGKELLDLGDQLYNTIKVKLVKK